ncbi:hypothetical protein, partial [Limnohabitans sp.]|uniref:hypothetical protein n=1 Tax=Limnohabitans sp. TaxID=1907725 RepID=UPI00311FDE70
MQDQLVKIIVQTGDQSQLKLFERKAGQPVPKLAVQPGQRISVDIDGQVQGVSQAKAMNPGKDGRLKLVKNGKDLKVMTPDGEEELVQLTGYFETSDVVLAGDQWAWASDVPLQQSSAGVSALPDGVAVAGAAPVDGVSSAAQAAAEAQSAQSAAIVGVPPLLYILGAAGGLAVAAAGGGGGTPADTTPPAAPSETKFTANADGTLTVSGKAEAGSKVEVTMPDGSKVQATA